MTNNSKIQVHLTVHQDTEDIHIDFQFDPENDSIDQVVNELKTNLNLTEEEFNEIKVVIQQQIDKTTNNASQNIQQQRNPQQSQFEPIQSTLEPIPPTVEPVQSTFEPLPESDLIDDSSDDDFINDPEYQSLLQKQKEEIRMLEEKHRREQLQLTQGQSSGTDDLIVFS